MSDVLADSSSSATAATATAAEALKEQGNAAFKAKQYKQAIDLFTAAIDLCQQEKLQSIELKESAVSSANSSSTEKETTATTAANQHVLISKCLVNRSLCYASLSEWESSAADAKHALTLTSDSVKAHYRLIKALLELDQFKAARVAFAEAFSACGKSLKDWLPLQEELLQRSGLSLNPKPTDFDILSELGEGNFTKVYKAQYKPTGKVYAVKTIEKATVERMKKRHPNINNEILMEKRALVKLSHPNIVTLFCTFQDFGTLYYQMEFVAGRDLWELLQENQYTYCAAISSITTTTTTTTAGAASAVKLSGDYKKKVMVGCTWPQAQFYFAEAIDALEYMHKRSIVHRDIKPENLIVGSNGHLKLIDFGTAKDLFQRDLNGPEFVGTPEYMSAETVRSSSNCGVAVDLWAIGAVLFQMLLGFTPFAAASPYLVFLRAKRCLLRLPQWLPAGTQSMLRGLLQLDPRSRLEFASGIKFIGVSTQEAEILKTAEFSYEKLRQQAFFSDWQREVANECTSAAVIDAMLPPESVFKYEYPHQELFTSIAAAADAVTAVPPPQPPTVAMTIETSAATDAVQQFTPPLPTATQSAATAASSTTVAAIAAAVADSAHDLRLRALAQCCLIAAATVAENGGIKPKDVAWLQNFDMAKLTALDRARVQHLLLRHERLHSAGVYRLFFAAAVDARLLRCLPPEREFIGFSRAQQGEWTGAFHFMQLAGIEFEATSIAATAASHSASGTAATSSPNAGAGGTTVSASVVAATSSIDASSVGCVAMGTNAVVSVATVAEKKQQKLREALAAVNKLRPKFLVVIGNLTASCSIATTAATSTTTTTAATATTAAADLDRDEASNQQQQQQHRENVAQLRRTMARLSESIPAVFVPGEKDVGCLLPVAAVVSNINNSSSSNNNSNNNNSNNNSNNSNNSNNNNNSSSSSNSSCSYCYAPTPESLAAYRTNFGADFFAFWFGGMRCIVLNSALMIYPAAAAVDSAEQDLWLTEELEQSKLCANAISIFSYHPWFLQHIDEEDDKEEASPVVPTPTAAAATTTTAVRVRTVRCFPKQLRLKWLRKMRHRKVTLTLSSSIGSQRDVIVPTTATDVATDVATTTAAAAAAAASFEEVRRPFVNMKRRKKLHDLDLDVAEDNSNNSSSSSDDDNEDSEKPQYLGDEPPKPSEIIAEAVAAGELDAAAAADSEPTTADDDDDVATATATATATAMSAEPAVAEDVVTSAATVGGTSENMPDSGDGSDSEEEQEFFNEHEDYDGPQMLLSNRISDDVITTAITAAASTEKESSSSSDSGIRSLRVVHVLEESVEFLNFSAKDAPKNMGDLLQRFATSKKK